MPEPEPGIEKLLIGVVPELRTLVVRKMRLVRLYASLSSGEREAPVGTRCLEVKAEVVVDNNARRRKVDVRVYTSIAVVVATAVVIVEVAEVVGRIAVAMK